MITVRPKKPSAQVRAWLHGLESYQQVHIGRPASTYRCSACDGDGALSSGLCRRCHRQRTAIVEPVPGESVRKFQKAGLA